MRYALFNSRKELPNPFMKNGATCPCCSKKVIPKCGDINIWHWAHMANDCDVWYEPESHWHINWKNNFDLDEQEVVVGGHRADVKTKDGLVIEFQNSTISADKINEREVFYGNMVWLLNGETFAKNLYLRKKDDIYTFRWKHPHKAWFGSQRSIFIDMDYIADIFEIDELSGMVFEIKKLYGNVPCGGWGKLITKNEFIARVKDDSLQRKSGVVMKYVSEVEKDEWEQEKRIEKIESELDLCTRCEVLLDDELDDEDYIEGYCPHCSNTIIKYEDFD